MFGWSFFFFRTFQMHIWTFESTVLLSRHFKDEDLRSACKIWCSVAVTFDKVQLFVFTDVSCAEKHQSRFSWESHFIQSSASGALCSRSFACRDIYIQMFTTFRLLCLMWLQRLCKKRSGSQTERLRLFSHIAQAVTWYKVVDVLLSVSTGWRLDSLLGCQSQNQLYWSGMRTERIWLQFYSSLSQDAQQYKQTESSWEGKNKHNVNYFVKVTMWKWCNVNSGGMLVNKSNYWGR